MHINFHSIITRRNITLLAFALTCVASSFVIGVRTAGDMPSVDTIEAHQANIMYENAIRGDMDGNGVVNDDDVIRLLDILEGKKRIDQQILQADPNRDGRITVDDIKVLLQLISH